MTRKSPKLLATLLVVAMVFTLIPMAPAASAADNPLVTVNWNNEYQTIDGVGTAVAFGSPNMLLQYGDTGAEGQALAQRLLDLLFDDEKGTGHDIVRVITGDGGLRPTGTKSYPGWNPLTGLRADANNPGYDVEGNKIPMLSTDGHAAADQNNASTYAKDASGHWLSGAFGYLFDGNRFYNGPSDSWWPNEPKNANGTTKLTGTGGILEDSGFNWQLAAWNQPIAGDTGGHTNYVAPADDYVYNQPVYIKDSARTMKDLFDVDQTWYMQQAMLYGIDTFYTCAWTPPYWMKTNNSMYGTDAITNRATDGNTASTGTAPSDYLRLDTDGTGRKIYFQAYADYLVGVVVGYWQEFGIPITHVDPWNESESSHGYSGYRFRNAAELAELVNTYIGPAFKKAFNTTDGTYYNKLLSPEGETLNWVPKLCGPDGTNISASLNAAGTLMNVTGGNQYMDVFTTHLYGTVTMGSGNTATNAPGSAPLTQGTSWPAWLRNYRIWQTEYMNNGGSAPSVDEQQYDWQAIRDGIQVSNLVANCFLSDPAFNAYIFWISFDNNGADGSDLFRLQTNGSVQNAGNIGTLTGTYRLFKRTYTFGHYGRYIEPGDYRIGANNNPVSGVTVLATARKSDLDWGTVDGKDFAITVTNTNSTDTVVALDFALENFPAGTTAVTVFRTSASENHAKLDSIPLVGGKFTVDVPARSVVTIVPAQGYNGSLPSLNNERDLFSSLEPERNDNGVVATEAGQAGRAAEAVAMANGDYLKFANVNFADGSAQGGITRRHLVYLNALVKQGAGGGVLRAYVVQPGTVVESTADLLAKGSPVGDILVPSGSAWNTYKTKLETGTDAPGDETLSAYGFKDLYLLAIGKDGAPLFTVDRLYYDADDLRGNNSTVASYGNILSNGNFETGSAASATGWSGVSGSTVATDINQNYSGLGKQLSQDGAFSLKVTPGSTLAGASTDVSGLVAGEHYVFNGFALDDPYAGKSVNSITATLNYYNSTGASLGSQSLSSASLIHLPEREAYGRNSNSGAGALPGTAAVLAGPPLSVYSNHPTSIEVMDWTQLRCEFDYNPPAGTTRVVLSFTADLRKTFYLDEISIISTPDRLGLADALNAYSGYASSGLINEAVAAIVSSSLTQAKVNELIGRLASSPSVSISSSTIVAGLAAWINVTTNAPDGSTAYLIDSAGNESAATSVADGAARIQIPAAPPAGNCKIAVKDINGLVMTCDLTVVEYTPATLWFPGAQLGPDGKLLIVFGGKIAAKDGLFDNEVIIGGEPVSCEIGSDGQCLIVDIAYEALAVGAKINVVEVKYFELFPSYIFNFNIYKK